MSKAYIKQFEQKLPHNVQQTEAVSAFRHCKLFRAAERFALQYTLLLYLFENHVLTQEETTSSPVQHYPERYGGSITVQPRFSGHKSDTRCFRVRSNNRYTGSNQIIPTPDLFRVSLPYHEEYGGGAGLTVECEPFLPMWRKKFLLSDGINIARQCWLRADV